jgi:hypothetical protein
MQAKPVSVIGIDPGFTGGIFALTEGRFASAMPMPIFEATGKGKKRRSLDLNAISTFLVTFRDITELTVYVEKVGVMPGEGPVGAFSFGYGTGQVVGLCFGLGIPVQRPSPQTWKKWTMEGQMKGTEAAVAQAMFPKFSFILPRCRKPHSGLTHGCLIAVYGWRVLLGQAGGVKKRKTAAG